MTRAIIPALLLLAAACGRDDIASASEEPDVPPATDDQVASELELAFTRDNNRSALSGGATTVFDISFEAFSRPAPNLSAPGLARHEVGDEAFGEEFEGTILGPVFDNISCEACHLEDGRGRPPFAGEAFERAATARCRAASSSRPGLHLLSSGWACWKRFRRRSWKNWPIPTTGIVTAFRGG